MYIFMGLAIHGSVNCGWPKRNFSVDWCKTVITPLQRPWSYCSCALSLWYNVDPSLYYSQIVMVVLWIADELNHTTVVYDTLLQKRYNNGICLKQTLDMRCIFRIIEATYCIAIRFCFYDFFTDQGSSTCDFWLHDKHKYFVRKKTWP